MNRRQNYRTLHAPDERRATLQVAEATVSGQLVDESSGGFGFRVKTDAPVLVGQEGRFRLGDVESIVRIVSVRREGQGTRIGLERLRELPPPKSDRRPSGHRAVVWYRSHNSNLSIALQLCVLLAVLLAAPEAIRYLAATPAGRPQQRPSSLQAWWMDQARWLFRGNDGPTPAWKRRIEKPAQTNERAEPSSEPAVEGRPGEPQPQEATDEPSPTPNRPAGESTDHSGRAGGEAR